MTLSGQSVVQSAYGATSVAARMMVAQNELH